MQQKEFQSKVSAILDETVFKLITNPLAFNALKWQDRRKVLVDIAGSISNNDLAAGNKEYEALVANLTNGKTLDDYRKQIAASIKKAKEDLKAIPTRIDEVTRSKPEAYDFSKLRADLENYILTLDKIDTKIADSNKAFQSKLDAQKAKRVQANNLKAEIQSIVESAKREAKEKVKPDTSILDKLKAKLKDSEENLKSAQQGLTTLSSKVVALENQIQQVDDKILGKRNEWAAENAKKLNFDESAFCCPTCKRDFEASDVEVKKAEMEANFKVQKAKNISEIQTIEKAFSEEKGNLQKEVEALNQRIENGKIHTSSLQEEINNTKAELETETLKVSPVDDLQENLIFESILSMNADYKIKKSELETLEANIEEIPAVNNTELVEKRKSLVSEIDSIKSKLQNETQINAIDQRIIVLQNEENNLAQQIANVEKTQFIIENFNKLKIDTLEQKINFKFKFVNFRMFETQINGGEVECCDALIDGVPFSDANTASKINAGLDIINTLCEFYQVTAPIFIDNRESIINLIDIESQIINLIVSETDKKLRVA
jgi:DNA repair exonuclease SbcCD ATPase subunit